MIWAHHCHLALHFAFSAVTFPSAQGEWQSFKQTYLFSGGKLSVNEYSSYVKKCNVAKVDGNVARLEDGSVRLSLPSDAYAVFTISYPQMYELLNKAELIGIVKSSGINTLIPFAKLSPRLNVGLAESFKSQQVPCIQSNESLFTLNISFFREITAPGFRTGIGLFKGRRPPQKPGVPQDEDEFDKTLSKYGLIPYAKPVSQEKSELAFESCYSFAKGASYASQTQAKSKALEKFDEWFQAENSRLDAELRALFANDESMKVHLRSESAKNMEELRVLDPAMYETILGTAQTQLKIDGYSEQLGREKLSECRINVKFTFTLTARLRDKKNVIQVKLGG
jgi:hypothetical protein